MDLADLKCAINLVLRPERDDEGSPCFDPPHSRLSTTHGLDTSYFRGPFDLDGDRAFERLVDDNVDPLHDTLQSISVPASLFTAALHLFGDSLIEYHEHKDKWGVYRFYPPILMTAWSAFEAWVRIYSEIFVTVVQELPRPVADALLEKREVVDDSGEVKNKRDSRPVLTRYWLLLKHGCNFKYDRGSLIWKGGDRMRLVRDSFVHYDASTAPSLTALEVWKHMEAMLLLLIEPSTKLRRTLFRPQFDLYSTLAGLQPFIPEFEERPLHKGWSKRATTFDCPFNGVDDTRYPPRWSAGSSKGTTRAGQGPLPNTF